jgi:hypothetical protein
VSPGDYGHRGQLPRCQPDQDAVVAGAEPDTRCTAMTAPPTDGPLGELGSLLDATITRVQQVTGAQSSRDTPRADSPAGVELAAEEARRPAPKEGSWPWLLAPMIASWALQVAVEEAKGFSAVLAPETTSYPSWLTITEFRRRRRADLRIRRS